MLSLENEIRVEIQTATIEIYAFLVAPPTWIYEKF